MRIGWILIILGIACDIFRIPFPLPLFGIAAIAETTIVVIIGAKLLWDVYKPHVNDALKLIAPETGRILTVTIIKTLLGVPASAAERTLFRLWDKGYLIQLVDKKNPDEKRAGFCMFKVLDEKAKPAQSTEQRTETWEYSADEVNQLILGKDTSETGEKMVKNIFRRF